MRYRGNIGPDERTYERTNTAVRQPENMPLETQMSGDEGIDI